MDVQKQKWRSPSLGKDMVMHIYGSSGTPIIGLPTRGADSHQWHNHGMTEALSSQIVNGYNQLFCLSSVDNESFMNNSAAPKKRLTRQEQYERYLIEEAVPYIREHNSTDYLMIAGTDLGGYQAITLALKHPREFNRAIGMSGLYNLRPFFGDHFSDALYYNNPAQFVPNLSNERLLNAIRTVDFRLVTHRGDENRKTAEHLSAIFRSKFIEHELDVWDISDTNSWNIWTQMVKTHII